MDWNPRSWRLGTQEWKALGLSKHWGSVHTTPWSIIVQVSSIQLLTRWHKIYGPFNYHPDLCQLETLFLSLQNGEPQPENRPWNPSSFTMSKGNSSEVSMKWALNLLQKVLRAAEALQQARQQRLWKAHRRSRFSSWAPQTWCWKGKHRVFKSGNMTLPNFLWLPNFCWCF